MTHYNVQVQDSQGERANFTVKTWRSLGGMQASWNVVDKGKLAVMSGPVQWADAGEYSTLRIVSGLPFYFPDSDLYMCRTGGMTWGIRLNYFYSWGTVNEQGDGILVQPWAKNPLAPGYLEWCLV